MLVLHSRNGYNDEHGGCDFSNGNAVFDIEEDGRIIGEITAQELRAYVTECEKAKMRPKYANLIIPASICNPEELVKQKQGQKRISFGIDELGRPFAFSGDKKVVTFSKSKSNGGNGNDYAFEFDNGFVIGVFNYTFVKYLNEFLSVYFSLFGVNESFSYERELSLQIEISEYSQDIIKGRVLVIYDTQEGWPNDYKVTTVANDIGSFELRRDGSVYKGESSDIVYDKARYEKELMQ